MTRGKRNRRKGILSEVSQDFLDNIPSFLLPPNPEIYLTDNFVTFDLETNTKGDEGSPQPCWEANGIVCGSWCHGVDGEAHNIYGNEYELSPLIQAIQEADFTVAYNGKFDLGWLKRAGLDLRKVLLYDPMIGEYCINANIKADLSLDATSKKYLGVGKQAFIDICMKNNVDPSDMPKSKLISRCDHDILATRDVFLQQREEIARRGLLGHVFTRCILSPALADIESAGMHIDADKVKALYMKSAGLLAAATKAMDDFTGGINPRSPKQVKEFVYEKLKFKPKRRGKTPIFSTRTEDLVALKATTASQRKFVELKKDFARHNADIGKNLLFFYGVATDTREDIPKDVFYAQFNQCVTVTHRLSSSGIKRAFALLPRDAKGKVIVKSIQFQNFARKYKEIFCARKHGWGMFEGDGAQLEFRVAAFLGQCPVATQAIVDNLDVHADTASQLHGMDVEEFKAKHLAHDPEVTDWRQDAKSHTFKPLFGGMSGTKSEKAYYTWFKEHYYGVGEVQQGWLDQAVSTKKVVLPHGFTFYFPECKMSSTGYISQTTNICNYPIQHLATAEIIPIAITYLWHAMKDMESFLVNTIHDSAIAESPPEEHEKLREYNKYAFTTLVYYYLKEVYGVEFNVPLGVGCKVGEHWGTGEELKCVPLPYYSMEGIDYSQLESDWTEG